ncbi:MAG: tripartite tricarboxylate transporter TctB family protein [Hyphomicrobiales bacterium]
MKPDSGEANSLDDTLSAPKQRTWVGTIGAILLLVLSLIFIAGGLELGLGIPTRLGTGAFPVLTGLIVLVLALFIFLDEFRGDGIKEAPDWIGFLAISAAIATFALLVDRLGLVPAAFLSVVVASMPDKSIGFPYKIVLGAFVALGCWALFIKAINLPFKAFVGI